MKKLLAILLTISIFLAVLCSCDSGNSETTTQSSITESTTTTTESSTTESTTTTTESSTTESTTEISFIADLSRLEPDRKDLPTKEQLLEIKAGMTYSEVVKKIGYPQRDVGSGIYKLQYDCVNGEVMQIGFTGSISTPYGVEMVIGNPIFK